MSESRRSRQQDKKATDLLPAKGKRKARKAAVEAPTTSIEATPLRPNETAEVSQERPRDIGVVSDGVQKKPSLVAFNVHGPDSRQPALNTLQSPFRFVCDLRISAKDGSLHTGTAWFITPQTLVTAGHCIAVFNPGNPSIHGKVRQINVMPARNGAFNRPFGEIIVPAQNLFVHEGWENQGLLQFDYGVIILPQPLPEVEGFFNFGHFNSTDLLHSAPTLSGYPDDKPEGTQWFEKNLIRVVQDQLLFYDIDTETGQSGSPVFFDNNGIACAIHSGDATTLNRGVRITPDVIAKINGWKI